MSTMTLEQVRDELASWLGGSEACLDAPKVAELSAMISAIDAYLAQPAQAVDVGAIREVINYLQDEGNACIATGDGLDAQWGSRILSMSRKLTRAISSEKAGPVDGLTIKFTSPYNLPASPAPDKEG